MEDLFVYIVVPLIISNILHMIIVRQNAFAMLAVPIWTSGFGNSKTWRGIIVLPLLNAFVVLIVNFFRLDFSGLYAFTIGTLMGLVYMLFELPNSYLKRRLGIASGGNAKKNRLFFTILDKTDSCFGVSLLSYFLLHISLFQTLQLLFISIFSHVFFSWLLVLLAIKKTF